ncbi:MAG: hypothetical protein JSV61_08350 [Anaerolineales bacterium]|nr:MAG: hypothetical protein JSV61_08350 [Anaerolineales bacterium]
MSIGPYLKSRPWSTWFGYLLFVAMLATGYYYNLTFIQLGLYDLGTRRVGMSKPEVAQMMAYLALVTCLVALLVGYLMMKRGWSRQFTTKLRLAFSVVVLQTVLTLVAVQVHTPNSFLGWILIASLALGVGVPVTFSLTVDLVPRRGRGYAGALVTALAYFAAEIFSTEWVFEVFRERLLWVMLPGTLGLGLLAFIRHPWLEALASQHVRPEFGYGRFVRRASTGRYHVRRRLVGLVILMFGIYFVDSLGFLRLLETPIYMNTAWQSPDANIRLFIAGVHVVGALIAGVLYTSLGERQLFLWIFGVFALTHLQYTFHVRLNLGDQAPLAMPMLYALAVSLYTVVNFAIWADVSTADTISWNAALGVALSGWTATFFSTALSIQWEAGGMPLLRHLNIVDALAMLFFVGLLVLSLFPEAKPAAQKMVGRGVD